MKKLYLLTLIGAIALSFGACESNDPETTIRRVTKIEIDEPTLTLEAGKTKNLSVELTPADAINKNVVWNSDNREVATIDENGLVTAVAKGTAKITVVSADNEDITDVCMVTVLEKVVLVEEILLTPADMVLKVRQTATFDAEVKPSTATDKSVTWRSDKPEIATVDENGLVTAISVGTAEISAVANDEGGIESARHTVTVESIPEWLEEIYNNMVTVEGGTFRMGEGCQTGNGEFVHDVTLSTFSISKYEVTQKQWTEIMGTTVEEKAEEIYYGITYGVGDDYPMYYVNREEVYAFIEKLNELSGNQFALPTEAQWEFAARGGNLTGNYKFSGSDDIAQVAWSSQNSKGASHPVGGLLPNELGLYDMSGNVVEWCSDWFVAYYGESPQTDPTGPETGTNGVTRGGSYERSPNYYQFGPADRWFCLYNDSGLTTDIGFRLALK